MMQVMRNPQRCRRTDSPSAHCDCAIPSDAGEPIVPLLTATARSPVHVSSVPSRSDTSGCRNPCTG
ncbi:hypothetical protein DPMN_043228 [Dreissena polymorpha]|uniref:Uncharacterized protein n=1 Tax=Dreissena polymorpha TaxID=45954 RepID=A0A9D4D2D0_DREPO|nr:hypothetical protein DPMN_043228 [Dreissena polymorpha]